MKPDQRNRQSSSQYKMVNQLYLIKKRVKKETFDKTGSLIEIRYNVMNHIKMLQQQTDHFHL